jgi:hypothetical protein
LANTLKIENRKSGDFNFNFVPSVLAIEKLHKHFHIRILNIYFRFLAKSLQWKTALKKVPTVWTRGS